MIALRIPEGIALRIPSGIPEGIALRRVFASRFASWRGPRRGLPSGIPEGLGRRRSLAVRPFFLALSRVCGWRGLTVNRKSVGRAGGGPASREAVGLGPVG